MVRVHPACQNEHLFFCADIIPPHEIFVKPRRSDIKQADLTSRNARITGLSGRDRKNPDNLTIYYINEKTAKNNHRRIAVYHMLRMMPQGFR